MGRRRRGLSPEDSALWDKVAATTTPMHAAAPQGAARADSPDAGELAAAPPALRLPVAPALRTDRLLHRPAPPPGPVVTLDLAPDPHDALRTANAHMDRRRFEKLRRGRVEPEARLDLHGMTSDEAHRTLTDFILTAAALDRRLVLIITGKGRAGENGTSPRRHGVLRHSLPHWLAAPPIAGRILQVAEAHARHGGSGAFYVCLRRRR